MNELDRKVEKKSEKYFACMFSNLNNLTINFKTV